MSIEKTITGGTIMVEDAIKHTGYSDINFAPSRRCKVELLFAVPEGENGKAYMEGVARVAQTKLEEMLKKTPAETVAVRGSTAAEAAAPKDTSAPAKPETAAAKKKREAAETPKTPEKTKADLAREAGLPADDGELLEDGPTVTAASKVVAEEDDLNDLLGDAAPVPITDAELGKAAQEKNAKMKNEHGEKWAPSKIRDLISKASDGKRINDIPTAARAKFMKDLDALKA